MSTRTAAGAGPVRAQDAFDVAAADAWLKAALPGLRGAPEVEQFAGGASNLTYLLRYPDRDLVLRRPPHGPRAKGAHDLGREHDVLRLLRPHFPLVPRVLARCADPGVIGSDFYVMERVPGVVLRADPPPGLTLAPPTCAALAGAAVDLLADLHAVDVEAAGLGPLYRGPGFVRRQVEGWSGRYRRSRTDDVPDGEDVMAWLASGAPDDVAAVLVHNDWRLDNLVLDPAAPQRIVAVLDWEMATVGDPLLELGNALAYWVQADDEPAYLALRQQPTHLPGMPTRAEVLERYLARSGRRVDDWVFYDAFGSFRLAVIAQQIWARYRSGQTTNPAFSRFGTVVGVLMARARASARPAPRAGA